MRVGLKRTYKRDAWELLGQYTYFSTRGTKKVNKPEDPTQFVLALQRDFTNATVLQQATSRTHFTYDTADLLFQRRFLPGSQILFRYSLGVTGAWIHDNWLVQYFAPAQNVFHKSNWTFQGGGFRTGVESDWHFGKGFGLFGKFAAAGLAGAYHYKNKISVVPSSVPVLIDPVQDVSSWDCIIAPMTQLALGFNWGTVWGGCAIQFMVGGEINTWYDLHQFLQDPQDVQAIANDRLLYRDTSNVNLYGLTARFNLDF